MEYSVPSLNPQAPGQQKKKRSENWFANIPIIELVTYMQ